MGAINGRTEATALHCSTQIDMAEPEDPDSIRRRRWHCSPLDDDDLLTEILVRLPPRPSSLPRASLVCKRWHRLATSPPLLRAFRAFHPAVLGVFHNSYLDNPHRRFVPAVDPPDRVPATLFRVPCDWEDQTWRFLDCRHGQALLLGPLAVLVWDPVTGARHRVPLPPDAGDVRHGAVLCSPRPVGDCRSRYFEVVLVWWKQKRRCCRAVAAVYSSVSRVWSEVVSPPLPSTELPAEGEVKPGTHVGSTFYWLLPESSILEFDLVRRSLALIKAPEICTGSHHRHSQLVVTKGGGLGFAVATVMRIVGSKRTKAGILLWRRDSCTHATGWSLDRNVELDRCLPLKTRMQGALPSLLGFHEERNMIFVWIEAGLFILQLESMQSKMVCQGHSDFVIYPFSGFYAADSTGEQDTGAPGPAVDGALEDFRLQPYTDMWHYTDPKGDVHGPFSLDRLLDWKLNGYFDESFRVWRTDQMKEQSVLLDDAITTCQHALIEWS